METDWLSVPYALKGKRVWVTGHRGMVGSALCRRLTREDCEILTTPREELDLCHQQDVKNWVWAHKPDVILIAAAKVGGIMANASYPAEFLYDNLMIAANIMQAAYETGCDRLLFLGSSCIYPRDCPQPITEDMILTGALEPTNEAYALAKIAGLKMAEYYRRQYGCDFISAMPCNLYGVGDRYDEQNSHVIPALIMKAHGAKIAGHKNLTVWGSGNPLREFLYVDDLADALVFLLKTYHSCKTINVGSGEEYSIREIAEKICASVGFEGDIVFDPSKPDGTPRKIMDSSRLREQGWKPLISLRHGLETCYADYLKG